MLLQVTGGKQAGYIHWTNPPADVSTAEGGVLVVPCKDHKGVSGPTLLGEFVGTSDDLGACAQIYVSDEHLRSLMDFATRTGATFAMIGTNAEQLPSFEAAWKKRASASCDQGALRSVVKTIAESQGRNLKSNLETFEQFKRVRMLSCQWHNGPIEFDDLVDLWRDAVTDGWDEHGASYPKPAAQHP